MKKILIGAGVLAAGLVLFFVLRRKKPQTTAGTLQPGGAFAPKTLTETDFLELEKVFSGGNPYQAAKVEVMEGQGESETSPTNSAGDQKRALSREMFNNMVLALIRQHIGQRSTWLQEVENKRFLPYDGTARAGQSDTLPKAWAYVARAYIAKDNYYTDGSTGSTATPAAGTGLTAYQAEVKAAPTAPEIYNLNWQPTNIDDILKADYTSTSTTGQPTTVKIYFSRSQKRTITASAARMAGVTI